MTSTANLNREETAQKRRQLILTTAVECFVHKGFHQTSIRDIASAAGISLGNLYNHFDSKNHLIAEIASLEAIEQREFEEALFGSDDPLLGLQRFVNDYVNYVQQLPNAILTIEITAEALRNPTISEGFIVNRQKLTKSIARVLANGIELGQFDPAIDKMEVAKLIIDLTEGLALRSAFAGKKASRSSKTALQYMIEKTLCI